MNMGNVTKLPTAATSYYTVHKRGQAWAVLLKTPAGAGKSLTTTIASYHSRSAAVSHAQAIAETMLRPCKAKGAT